MGTPISATVVHDDGSMERYERVDAALARAGDGCVELHYAYAADALPEPLLGRFDMWRYARLLPLDPGRGGAGGREAGSYPLPVGGTPLVAAAGLRAALSMPRLWLKDETRGPTGSNKDRATALVLQDAMNRGIETVSCASTGNVAVSLAVGAAAAGKHAVVFVPAGVDRGKLSFILAAGATVVMVAGGYEAAFRLSREAAGAFGWYDRNTGVNPLTLEGKKTVAFEIWEQLARAVPDVVVSPVGDGVTLSALAKGFRELAACAATPRVPRLIGVQAEGCQPLVRAWDAGAPQRPAAAATLADGIAVSSPVNAAMALRDVRESGGGFVAIPDDAILDAVALLAAKAGLLAEPAGAAATAGLLAAAERGLIRREESVVVLVTGSAFKTPRFLRPAAPPVEVSGGMAELRRVLRSAQAAGRRE
jgi:threonine synthase